MIIGLSIIWNQSKHSLNVQNQNGMEFIDTYGDQFSIARVIHHTIKGWYIMSIV